MRANIRRVALIAASWTAISALIFFSSHFYFVASLNPDDPPSDYNFLVNAMGYMGGDAPGSGWFG